MKSRMLWGFRVNDSLMLTSQLEAVYWITLRSLLTLDLHWVAGLGNSTNRLNRFYPSLSPAVFCSMVFVSFLFLQNTPFNKTEGRGGAPEPRPCKCSNQTNNRGSRILLFVLSKINKTLYLGIEKGKTVDKNVRNCDTQQMFPSAGLVDD